MKKILTKIEEAIRPAGYGLIGTLLAFATAFITGDI